MCFTQKNGPTTGKSAEENPITVEGIAHLVSQRDATAIAKWESECQGTPLEPGLRDGDDGTRTDEDNATIVHELEQSKGLLLQDLHVL